MIKEIEYIFKTVTCGLRFGPDEISDAADRESVQDCYFTVERELLMRFDQTKAILEQNGYWVNVTHIPIPESGNLNYTRIDVTNKSQPYAVAEFYDNAPVRK